MENILEIVVTAVGILILFSSVITLAFIMRLLKRRAYGRGRWIFVQVLLFFFVIGYGINAAGLLGYNLFEIIRLQVTGETLVSFVYFFGGVFTIVTIIAIRNMLRDILGKEIPDEEAVQIFLRVVETKEEKLSHLRDTFTVNCQVCNNNLPYSIASVVRDHAFTLERGIQVEEVFGTISYKLRPVHKCKDGRREITVVHDDKLATRNVEENRLQYSGTL